MQEREDQLIEILKRKSYMKQEIFRNSAQLFKRMKGVSQAFVTDISSKVKGEDKDVTIEYRDISEFEFHIKFAGELLVFSRHSNVVTFPEGHILTVNPYIQGEYGRNFYIPFMAYNFLADSLKYNRLGDPGYLIARMFVNKDEHFYIEGVKQMNFLYPDIAQNVISDEILLDFVESSVLAALENDSIMGNYEANKVIMVRDKLQMRMMGKVEKVGFKYQSVASDGGS